MELEKKTEETNETKNKLSVDIDMLKGVIVDTCKKATKEELNAIKTEINNSMLKKIFPFTDGMFGLGGAQSFHTDGNPSIIDTSCFYKNYQRNFTGANPVLNDGIALGTQLSRMQVPFKRLSPEMEMWAKMIKLSKGDLLKAISHGINIVDYNHKVKDILKQHGLNETTLEEGGVLVPIEFYTSVIEFSVAQSPLLSKVWRIPMNSNVLRIPRLQQAAGSYFGGIQLYSVGEGKEKTQTKPGFDRLTFEAKKRIGLVYLTDELIADSTINIVNYLFGLFARAFQYDLEGLIINGTGGPTVPCLGILNDPAVPVVPRTTGGTISYEDILNLDAAIDENFTNLVWLTRKATQIILLGLRDNANRPIFLADYGSFTSQPNSSPTLNSYPVIRTRNVPQPGARGDLILADPSFYILAIRQDMTIDQSNAPGFTYDETALRFVMRYDGAPAISSAFAILGNVES